KLQPRIQLAMVRQQHARPVAADEPGRSGEMPNEMRPIEHAVRRAQEPRELVCDPGPFGTGEAIRGERVFERVAWVVHGAGKHSQRRPGAAIPAITPLVHAGERGLSWPAFAL